MKIIYGEWNKMRKNLQDNIFRNKKNGIKSKILRDLEILEMQNIY